MDMLLQNIKQKKLTWYSETLLYGYKLNTDTSLLRTLCIVPGEKKSPYIFSKFNLGHPVYTDSFL